MSVSMLACETVASAPGARVREGDKKSTMPRESKEDYLMEEVSAVTDMSYVKHLYVVRAPLRVPQEPGSAQNALS